jgi:predicted kinase
MDINEMREKLAKGNVGVVMVGCSGSGKSTLAAQICPEEGMIVSTDEMRRLVSGDASNQKCSRYAFDLAHTLWAGRMRFRQATIFDATSTTPKARKQLTSSKNDWNTLIAIVVDESLDVCKNRNLSRERVVPEWVIDKQMDQFNGGLQTLVENDKFDEVWRYTTASGFTKMERS